MEGLRPCRYPESVGRPLRVLLIEDSENDALLVVGELERGGWDVAWERVDTREAMAESLDRSSFDLAISDYRMPRFRAPDALALWHERGLESPFIVVSGTIGEEHASNLPCPVRCLSKHCSDIRCRGSLT